MSAVDASDHALVDVTHGADRAMLDILPYDIILLVTQHLELRDVKALLLVSLGFPRVAITPLIAPTAELPVPPRRRANTAGIHGPRAVLAAPLQSASPPQLPENLGLIDRSAHARRGTGVAHRGCMGETHTAEIAVVLPACVSRGAEHELVQGAQRARARPARVAEPAHDVVQCVHDEERQARVLGSARGQGGGRVGPAETLVVVEVQAGVGVAHGVLRGYDATSKRVCAALHFSPRIHLTANHDAGGASTTSRRVLSSNSYSCSFHRKTAGPLRSSLT